MGFLGSTPISLGTRKAEFIFSPLEFPFVLFILEHFILFNSSHITDCYSCLSVLFHSSFFFIFNRNGAQSSVIVLAMKGLQNVVPGKRKDSTTIRAHA